MYECTDVVGLWPALLIRKIKKGGSAKTGGGWRFGEWGMENGVCKASFVISGPYSYHFQSVSRIFFIFFLETPFL